MNELSREIPDSLPGDWSLPEVLNSLPDGVYVTDLNRRILFWNRAAERITGWRPEDVLGRSCSENILAHVDKDGHLLCGCEHCPLHRSMVTGQPSTEALVVFARRKFGPVAPLEVSVAPIRDRGGRIVGGIETFRDITASMQDLLKAKAIQDQSITLSLSEDSRVEVEIRYQPREIVGGDFCRVERGGGGDYAVLVADAMGHGVAAALQTMQLRSLWEEHRGDLASPARFLEMLNERLHGLVGDDGYFATAISASYEPGSGVFHCARAGHPAPLLFRRSGTVESVAPPQLALGMMPGTRYAEFATELEPGDSLLLFTDGAVEIFDSQDRQLGTEGLKRLVREQCSGPSSAGFHLDQLEKQLLCYSDNIRLPDDLTLVKFERRN